MEATPQTLEPTAASSGHLWICLFGACRGAAIPWGVQVTGLKSFLNTQTPYEEILPGRAVARFSVGWTSPK